jgi:hypothetical protein
MNVPASKMSSERVPTIWGGVFSTSEITTERDEFRMNLERVGNALITVWFYKNAPQKGYILDSSHPRDGDGGLHPQQRLADHRRVGSRGGG